MKKRSGSRTSLSDIAKAAGISKAAVCYALQNRPKISKTTRARVLRLAQRLGYVPDARLGSWMANVNRTRTRDLLPIAWLNTNPERNAWREEKFLSPYFAGAQKQALALGYRLDEIWTHEPGMTMRRISQILDQRGIEGAIISYPARHFRLNWEHLAGVCIGTGLLAPLLHRVTADLFFNLNLALKMVKRFGYRRIGICLDEVLDRRHAQHAIRAMAHYLNATTPKSCRVPPLFYGGAPVQEKVAVQILRWIKREKPDVIIGHHNNLVVWAEEAGLRVPRDVGIVHLATDDDVNSWAGICSNKREIGADAVKMVVSLLQTREFGLPKVAMNTYIRGAWHPGKTLLVPKPK
jgi:LacI family transcriptional regulator